MKINKILSVFFILLVVLAGCKKDDYTGHSQLVPTNPTITVDLGTIAPMIDGVDQTHTITLNMDVAQVVDVAVHVLVLEGTATEGEDFSVPSVITIPAGKTTASFNVTVLADEINEETETFKIQIGDERTANATLTPVEANFTIQNFSDADLKVGLSWEPAFDVYSPTGDIYDATDLADLILTIYDVAGDSIYDQVDGGSFEEVVLSDTMPDGTYQVMVSFWSAMDPGTDVDLNLFVDFYQIGVFSETDEFPAFFSLYTSQVCSEAYVMIEIEKAGSTWTSVDYVDPNAEFLGAYGGTDGADPDYLYDSEIVTSVCGTSLLITGINFGWMQDFWGEEIIASTPVIITLNGDNTITIDDQYYITTEYSGAPYDYDIRDVVGTWADGGVLHIEYDMYNTTDDYSVGTWCFDNGYSDYTYFIAEVTLGAKASNKNVVSPKSEIRRLKNK
ncbi:MAG: hypothetical protein JXL97_08820 [Bacteroidales bacterium]|nr:hypothetical protein [Bacteroidales bacterium]